MFIFLKKLIICIPEKIKNSVELFFIEWVCIKFMKGNEFCFFDNNLQILLLSKKNFNEHYFNICVKKIQNILEIPVSKFYRNIFIKKFKIERKAKRRNLWLSIYNFFIRKY